MMECWSCLKREEVLASQLVLDRSAGTPLTTGAAELCTRQQRDMLQFSIYRLK